MKRPLTILLCHLGALCLHAVLDAVPDPMQLNTGWYEQLEDSEENQGQLDLLISNLKVLSKQLDKEQHPLVTIHIEKVLSAIDQLQNSRKEESTYTPLHPLYLSSYSLADVLRVAENIRTLEQHINIAKVQQKTLQLKIDRLLEELDFLRIEYGTNRKGSVERLKTGLQIMESRLHLDVLKLNLLRTQKKQVALEENLPTLETEQEIALERLDLTKIKPQPTQRRLEKLDALRVDTSKLLLELNDEGQLLNVRIQLQIIEARNILESIKLVLARLHDHKDALPPDTIEQLQRRIQRIAHSIEEFKELRKTFSEQVESASLEDLKQLRSFSSKLDTLTALKADNQMALTLLQAQTLATTPKTYRLMSNIWDQVLNKGTWLTNSFSTRLFRINEHPVTLWVLLRALAIFVSAIVTGRLLLRGSKRLRGLRLKIGRDNLYIISRIIYYTVTVVGLLAAFYSLGFSLTNFLIIAGALGVGIGLGLQAIVNNFFSGLVVLFSKILKLGDVVETKDGLKGIVRAINMQNIHIHTFDGKDIVLPNADLVTKRLVNWTMADPFVRLHIPFDIPYGTDEHRIEEIVINLAKKIPHTITNESLCPPPKVWLKQLGASALNMELVVWVNVRDFSSRGDMETTYLWEIERELLSRGIEMPGPQIDIRMRELPPLNIHQPSPQQEP